MLRLFVDGVSFVAYFIIRFFAYTNNCTNIDNIKSIGMAN
jgi:hypothetical protein